MDRRGFLGSILALGAAPAIVRAESLMRIIVPVQELYRPTLTLAARGNQLLTIDQITAECLRILNSNLLFVEVLNKQYDISASDNIRINKPRRYVA